MKKYSDHIQLHVELVLQKKLQYVEEKYRENSSDRYEEKKKPYYFPLIRSW